MTSSGDTKQAWAAIFDRAAPTYDAQASSYFAHAGRRLAHHLQPKPGAAILDVACGRGAALFGMLELAGSAARGMAVDISPGMVDAVLQEASRRGLSNVTASVMDAEKLDVPDASFDVVCSAFSLHFLPDPEGAARGFRRVLRSGGRVGLSEWGATDPAWTWEDALIREFPMAGPSVSRPFDHADDVVELLSAAAFSGIHTATESWTIRLADEDEWWRWKWSFGFRRHLDAMTEQQRERYRARATELMQPLRTDHGYERKLQAHFITADRD